MARRFLTNVDLASFALQNALMHPLASDPTGLGSGDAGKIWFNTTSGKVKFWDGAAAIDATARAAHTGTQLAATISDLASTVKAYRLDEFAAATSPITVANGSSSGHAVNKGQLDAVAASAATGTSIKDPVRAASTADVTVGSTGDGATMDGVTLATGDRVLLKDQDPASENGIYTVGASALTRAGDMDATGEVKPGTLVFVAEGTANGDKQFAVTSDVAVTVGTTDMTWGQITGSGTSYSGGEGLTLSGSTFAVGEGIGITVNADDVAVDTAVVARKVTGVVPASTSGIFSVSGAVVTVNHALDNSAPRVTVRYYTSPGSGNTQGALVEVDEVASDSDNVVLTFPAAPSANQYYVSLVG